MTRRQLVNRGARLLAAVVVLALPMTVTPGVLARGATARAAAPLDPTASRGGGLRTYQDSSAPDASDVNYIDNPSVERDDDGWAPYTDRDELTVDYNRDPTLGFDGEACLRLRVRDSESLTEPKGGAFWIYTVEVDSSMAGRRLSAASYSLTSNADLVPRLTLEFWKRGRFLSRVAAQAPISQAGWTHHKIESVEVPRGTTVIRVLGSAEVTTAGSTGSVWFDAFELEDASTNDTATHETLEVALAAFRNSTAITADEPRSGPMIPGGVRPAARYGRSRSGPYGVSARAMAVPASSKRVASAKASARPTAKRSTPNTVIDQ